MAEDQTGTAGTLEPTEGTTGTPGDGTTGTPEANETTGTPATEAKRYRLDIGGREVELSEDEIVSRAQEALGLKVEAERRNQELRDARAQADFYRDRVLGGAQGDTFGHQAQAHHAPSAQEVPAGLDPNDPRDAAIIAADRRAAALEQRMAQQAIAGLLREQHAELSDREKYPGYDRDRAITIIREGVANGKKLDLFDAYHIDRGRQAPDLERQSRERAEREAAAAAAAARNRQTLPVATASSGSPAKRDNYIPVDRVRSMRIGDYKKLKSEGWEPDPRGGLVRRSAS